MFYALFIFVHLKIAIQYKNNKVTPTLQNFIAELF